MLPLLILFVVGLNLVLALACCYTAWRIWQLRRKLANVADTLTRWEYSTHRVLKDAPDNILKAQTGTTQARAQYQTLMLRLQRLRQILVLIGVGQQLWSRQVRRQRRLRRFPQI
ncbi:MAG: hypothetical protein AAFZ49_01650 [Cyanobacteria bacterium J06659_2]